MIWIWFEVTWFEVTWFEVTWFEVTQFEVTGFEVTWFEVTWFEVTRFEVTRFEVTFGECNTLRAAHSAETVFQQVNTDKHQFYKHWVKHLLTQETSYQHTQM